jgi:hypothetical protein
MASWGFFFVGLFVAQATLVLFLAIIRQDSAVEVVDSAPLAAGHETPACHDSFLIEVAFEADQLRFIAVPPTATIQSSRRRPTPQLHLVPRQ